MLISPLTQRILNKIRSATGWGVSEKEILETEVTKKSESINCSQAVSKLKAYKKTHQDLQQQFSDFMSQFPYLPDIRTDEPFMQSPHYKILTDSPKEVFHNFYDAKQEARRQLGELKEIINYEEKQFSKLTKNQKIEYLYSRCFHPNKDADQERQYTQPTPDIKRYELVFLYDNYADKKLSVITSNRDKNADMLKIFDCTPDQIIHNQTELKQAIKDKKPIKAYWGELFPNFFQILPQDVEYIYTEFPESKIRQKTIKLGTGIKTKDDFEKAIKSRGGKISGWAKEIMSKRKFKISEKESNEKLVILSVKDLGFTVKEIFERAKELGLKLCPPEAGPQLILQYPEQPFGEHCVIGMNPIYDSNGNPRIFSLDRDDDEPSLKAYFGRPVNNFDGSQHFAFARK